MSSVSRVKSEKPAELRLRPKDDTGHRAARVNILIVDDDEVDIESLQRGFRSLKIDNPVFVARDGQDALDLLHGGDSGEPLNGPLFIILDINMPRMNGIEFLRNLRADERYQSAIVFVLTTSDHDRDKIDAYSLNVAGYILKSDVGSGIHDAISLLDHYWHVVEFPSDE